MTGIPLAVPATSVSSLWYATRATGVVALILLTATVILGIAGTVRFAAPGLPRVVTAGLHRNISLLVLGFVALHVLTAVLDTYAHIGLVSAVIPFSSSYRGFWLGLGTVAFDLVLALALTSLLRGRLSYRTWRAVHWTAYASWPVALWHALGTGTDARLPWLLVLDATCVGVVAAAMWWRLSVVQSVPGRRAAIAALMLMPVATAVFVVVGPLQPGWARRAGTPATLLGSGTPSASSAAPASPAGALIFTGSVPPAAGPTPGEVTFPMDSRTSSTPRRTRRLVARLHRTTGAGGPTWEADVTLIISGDRASGQLSIRAAGPA